GRRSCRAPPDRARPRRDRSSSPAARPPGGRRSAPPRAGAAAGAWQGSRGEAPPRGSRPRRRAGARRFRQIGIGTSFLHEERRTLSWASLRRGAGRDRLVRRELGRELDAALEPAHPRAAEEVADLAQPALELVERPPLQGGRLLVQELEGHSPWIPRFERAWPREYGGSDRTRA